MCVCSLAGTSACASCLNNPNSTRQANNFITWNTSVEIVRCRDCEYYGCYDGSTWCSRTYEQVPGGTCDYQTVEPNGFCAWGKRKRGAKVVE